MPEDRRRQFMTTRWSLVLAAGADDSLSGDAGDALARLCEAYWYPLYAYLRRHGRDADQAQDLTQAFFARLVEKRVIRMADPARGRFRSFLLTSLKNFASNERDRERAVKRGGGATPLSLELDGAEQRFQLEVPTGETPERIFDRQWAHTLLTRVMARLQAEMTVRSDKAKSFDRLKTYLTGEVPQPSYAETASELAMSEGAVKVSVHRLRKRFRDLVRAEIAHTVSSPEDIEDELRHLWSSVSR